MSSLSSISGTKLSQHTHTSSPTGTKLSQHTQNCPFQPVLPEQGELCTARTTTPPSRENFVPHPAPNPVQNSPCSAGPPAQPVQNSPCSAGPGAHPVQNSPHTPTPAAHPVQNSPCSAGPSAQPVQNSPNTPKKAHFSQFCPSGENFVPHPPPRPPAGRTLYRSHHHDAQQGELCTAPSAKPGTKLSQHTRSTAVPRKSSPSTPKNGVFASFASAGRIISRTSKQQATQGELFRALGIEQEVLTKVVCADI